MSNYRWYYTRSVHFLISYLYSKKIKLILLNTTTQQSKMSFLEVFIQIYMLYLAKIIKNLEKIEASVEQKHK